MGPNESLNHPAAPASPPHAISSHAPSPLPHAPQPADPQAHAMPTHVPAPHPAPASPQAPNVSPPSHAPLKPSSPLFTLGVACLVVVIIGWLLVSLLGMTRAGESGELDKKLSELDTQLKSKELVAATAQYNSIETVITQIEQLRKERLMFDPTWQTIKLNVPKDVQFTNFSLGDDDVFRIAGVGRSITSVAQFAAALSQQGQFKTVTPLAMDKQDEGDLYNFSISFKRGVGQ